MRLIRSLAVVVGSSVVLCNGAIAGGLDEDGPADTESAGPVYFGFVRDERGTSVEGAEVVLRPRKGLPYSLRSNAMGLYRGHINKFTSPDDVQISCEKPGYREIKVFRRTPPGKQDMIQTECTLRRL